MSSRLCVVGAGWSGAVTAACLANLGHTVCAVDVDKDRVETLRQGQAPFYEPDLDDTIARNLEAGRLSFTSVLAEGMADADAVMLCVQTPAAATGEADLSALWTAVRALGPLLRPDVMVITRSTVPVGTNAALARHFRKEHSGTPVDVVSNPEFLREGHAVEDFTRPDRVLIGAADERAGKAAAALYDGIERPIIVTDLETAELTKYAANAYLAASISFINEIANICERTGADVSVVSETLALDRRIGPNAYLDPGIGFGGSCLPKDLSALITTAEAHGHEPELLKAIAHVNELQPKRVLAHLEEIFDNVIGLDVAVLGISFKGDTFDARSSPALAVIRLLSNAGVRVHAYDPMADGTADGQLEAPTQLHGDAYAAVAGCHALIVATDHSQFKELDLDRLGGLMQTRVLIDGRNVLDPDEVTRAGFSYVAIGRPQRGD
ncbi:MAG: UDP-glucose/GDP-mannose dehydrogenase family protein [Dehalococcoidia bacterium]